MDARKSARGLAFACFVHPLWEFGGRKYCTDHRTHYAIHGFGNSVWVGLKIHACYCRICENSEQHNISCNSTDG